MQPHRRLGKGKYLAVARLAVRNRLAYPQDVLGRTFFLAFILFVYSRLWLRVLGGSGEFGGFTGAQLVWYMAFTEAIALGFPRLQNTVSEDVKTGNIAYRLNKPLNYLGQLGAEYLGEAAVNILLTVAVGAAAALVLAGPLPGLTPGGLAGGLLVMAGGTVLSFVISAGLTLTAFWVEDNGPYFWIYSKINFVLGGLFIPVEVYPGFLRAAARVLPFRHIFGSAARLLVRFDPNLFLRTVGLQACWSMAILGLVVLVYRLGVRKLNVNGG